ncbi:MAG: hypothetical protein A2V79_08390 [Betaproteobacteria bacterium RBG_16_56_24]|nr:MAG: hypothetical protein A2V79_08390 [Betaproteobacteria bacterium RBG_16_56_24]
MSNYTDNLEYSLAKRVPDMERGFTIETSYGGIVIEADQAPKIIKAVRAALQRELAEAKMVRPGISQPKPGVTRHRCV